MARALFLSPMVPSTNLEETAGFLRECLEFQDSFQSPTYRILEKDGLTVHLLPAGRDIGQSEFYLEVDDVDGLWRAMKEKVGHLRHREPFDREYGMREVHIEVPATKTLLFIGESLPKA